MAEALKLSAGQRFPENLPPGWAKLLAPELSEKYFRELVYFLNQERERRKRIFPPAPKILRALQLTDYDDVKVVILGQDPYHGEGEAMGLCFAVPNEHQPKPPSLQNIFKELKSDLGFVWNGKDSELSGWANQGVLLLNTVLSVERDKAFSHRGRGWEIFTDKIIQHLDRHSRKLIFVLWGAAAQKKAALINKDRHYILNSAHPSPLSAHRGFFGCCHFSKINSILKSDGSTPIDWTRIND